MRYSLQEIDNHDVVASTTAVDRDEALEWFSEKLRLMLTFEGDPANANYLLDEWPEGLLAHSANPTIPVFLGHHEAQALVRASREPALNSVRLHMCLLYGPQVG
jgi:hypothetical protein